MCYWHYYYYGACRHGETVLHKYCDKAKELPPKSHKRKQAMREKAQRNPDAIAPHRRSRSRGGANGQPERSQPDTSSPSSFFQPPSSRHNIKHHRKATSSSAYSFDSSSVDHSVTSIPEETAEDIASLHQQHQHLTSPRRHSEPPTPDMAGLAQFGRSAFKQLMVGGGPPQLADPITTTKNHNDRDDMRPELNQQGGSLRVRQSGIRDQSDESYNLPDSSEILRHIAGSCHGDPRSSNIGTDSRHDPRHEPCFGSEIEDFAVNNGPTDPSDDSWDLIENDVDDLKKQITTLRAEPGQTPRTNGTHSTDTYSRLPRARSKLPVPDSKPFESNAARLKARFEQQEMERQAKLAKEKDSRDNAAPEAPPGPNHFPSLGTPTSISPTSPTSKHPRKSMETQSIRKLSYASAATSHFATPQSQGSKPASGSTVAKQSPRFAQPTMATARRAGETARKDSANNILKTSPEASPNKSTRTITQRQQKRQPIPGAWTVSSPETSPSKESFEIAGSVKHGSSLREMPSHMSEDPLSTEKKGVFTNSPERGLRKKTSSYMSPTKATTRRNLETLGQHTVKESPPRTSKPSPRIDTSLSLIGSTASSIEGAPPLSGSMAISSPTPAPHFQPRNITDEVLRRFVKKPPGLPSSTVPEEFIIRTTSSSATSVFSSPLIHSAQGSRRSTLSCPIAPLNAANAHKVVGLPHVANTTVKRRGSHGHVLVPIVKRLGKEGLLRSPANVANSQGQQAQYSVGADAQDMIPGLPTGYQAEPSVNSFQVCRGHAFAPSSAQPVIESANIYGSFNAPLSMTSAAKTGSLRATAQEFKPLSQLQTDQQHAQKVNEQSILDFHSEEDWSKLTWEERKNIQDLRLLKKMGQSPVRDRQERLPMVPYSPEKPFAVAASAHYHDSITERESMNAGTGSSVDGEMRTSFWPQECEAKYIARNIHQPHNFETGAILKPEIDPATGSIHWVKQALDGSKEVVHFGRAPDPSRLSPSTPHISPSSIDTSPRKSLGPSPSTAHRWRVGSLLNDKYGWKGGDGREISFRGNGTHAERDRLPPSDVDLGFKNGRPGYRPNGARFVGGSNGDGPDSPPLAPRSREQWAKLSGMPKVPCSEINIEGAWEAIPRPPLLPNMPMGPFGFCRPCYPDY